MLVVSATVSAEPVLIGASHERNGSSFILDFPAFDDGSTLENEGRVAAEIAHTDFALEIDAVAGTANFMNYSQTIDSLNLFGVETGPLEVTISASLGGVFFSDGTFQTEDTYEVRWFRDLSALGLEPEDPAHPELGGVRRLDSTSSGRMEIQPDRSGIAEVSWVPPAGGPAPQLLGFEFSYTCSMTAVFAVTPASLIAVELLPLISDTTMSESLRSRLTSLANSAITAFNLNNKRTGVRELNKFIQTIQRAGAADIAAADGQLLIQAAMRAIQLTGNPLTWPMRTQSIREDKRATHTTE